MTSIEYLDISKHIDTLEERYTTNSSGFGTVIKEGTRLDKLLHDYAVAVHEAKGMGRQDEFPELVPVVLQYDPNAGKESTTHPRKRALPNLTGNGEALLVEQLGGTVNEEVHYAVLLPSNDLPSFEKDSQWIVSYTPQGIAEAFLENNYLNPRIWSDEGNPVTREAFFRVLNQSTNLDEDETLEWKGEPNSNELLGAGVQRNEYNNLLRKIAGIDIEEDRETVVARTARGIIQDIPRQKKISLIDEHGVEMETPPQFATEMEMVDAIYDQLGDVRDIDDYSEYVEPEPEAPTNE